MAVGAGSPSRIALRHARVEDWILVGWMALVAPALVHLRPPAALFEGGRPLDGLVGLVGIAGALACLASRQAGAPHGRGLAASAAVGPFVGGLLFVAADTDAALGLSSPGLLVLAAGVVALLAVVRLRVPPLSRALRRVLVLPYLLVSGRLFWTAVDAVTAGGHLPESIRAASASDLPVVLPIAGFLLAFSAVHYAMLVYAPRQVAEREGSPLVWLARYALFVVSVGLGAGWLALLSP